LAAFSCRGRSVAGQHVAPLIAAVQRAARAGGVLPLHIAADEEGGLVQSVTGPGIPPWPSAREQASWTPHELTARSRIWASSLKAMGHTLDLGPVADVVSIAHWKDNRAIGAYGREYGTTPAAAAQRVGIVTASLQRAGVGATAKHFPGLGRVRAITDTSTSARDDLATRTDGNLAPFEAAARDGATAVMMSSAGYPHLDPAAPAVWSGPIITALLRRQYRRPQRPATHAGRRAQPGSRVDRVQRPARGRREARRGGEPAGVPLHGWGRYGRGMVFGGFGGRSRRGRAFRGAGYGQPYGRRRGGGGCVRDACLLEGGCCLAEALDGNCLLLTVGLAPQLLAAFLGGSGRARGIETIRVYQEHISPRLAGRCRFTPSCSHYAAQALAAHGTVHGSWLTVRRLVRCRPGGPRGLDPVPG